MNPSAKAISSAARLRLIGFLGIIFFGSVVNPQAYARSEKATDPTQDLEIRMERLSEEVENMLKAQDEILKKIDTVRIFSRHGAGRKQP